MLQNICFNIIISLQRTGFEHATIEHWASLCYIFEWDYTCSAWNYLLQLNLSVNLSFIIVAK
jgi:hypothetical protein